MNLERKVEAIILGNSTLRRMYQISSPSLFPGSPFASCLLIPIRSLFEYLIRSVIRRFSGQANLVELRRLRGAKSSKCALVVASGPSVASLIPERVRELRELGIVEVFSVNTSVNSPNLQKTGVDYVVISDPAHDISYKELSKKFGLVSLPRLPEGIFVPRHFSMAGEDCPAIPFEDVEFPRLGRSISPLSPRRYLSLTALKALSIVQYLGYKQVFIIGFDASMFQTLRVNATNNLMQHPHHVEGAGMPAVCIDSSFPGGMMDFHYDSARYHFQLRKYFAKLNIVNLDPNSFTDAFPKRDPMSLTSNWH